MVMVKVNIFEVKARLSEYLDRAANGEHVVICRHNTPIAELRPLAAARTQPRPLGPIKGRPRFDVSLAFFDPMTGDELAMWEGGNAGDPLLPGRRRAKQVSKVAEPGVSHKTTHTGTATRRKVNRSTGKRR